MNRGSKQINQGDCNDYCSTNNDERCHARDRLYDLELTQEHPVRVPVVVVSGCAHVLHHHDGHYRVEDYRMMYIGSLILFLLLALSIGAFVAHDRQSELTSADIWRVSAMFIIYVAYMYYWLA